MPSASPHACDARSSLQPLSGEVAGWRALAAVGVLARGDDASRLRNFLAQLLTASSSLPGYEMLKFGQQGEVCKATLPLEETSIDVICKGTSPASGITGRLRARMRPTRGRLNADRAAKLQQAGIHTAEPLALLEHRNRPGASWLITRYIARAVDLDQFLLNELGKRPPASDLMLRRNLARAVADVFARMDRAGLYHRDMKATNLLVTLDESGLEPRVYVVDLDGLSDHQPRAARRLQPVVRLTASLLDHKGVRRTDCARFLRAYMRYLGRLDGDFKATWQYIASAAGKYATGAQKRKRGKIDSYGG